MKALILEAYNPNLIRALRSMKITDLEKPVPSACEVLVKIQAAPINPSDIAFIRGGYNIKKSLPAIPGFEGTGIIEVVDNKVDEKLIGKRVSFFSQEDKGGTWAEYVAVKLSDCLFVNEKMPVDQAACLFVNPLTAYAMLDHVFENQHEAIIQSAALGQVGRFISAFAKEKGIKLINLVRKEKQVDELKVLGETYVLDINSEDFAIQLKQIAIDLKATAAIDAVGGELTGKILNAMPAGSEVILYGGLSGMPVSGIDSLEIIFNNKILGGFNLGDWLNEQSSAGLTAVSDYLQELFISGRLQTKVQSTVSLDNFYDGLKAYISDMSGGKVLFGISN
jgi:NADPH:quinone reductase-like Zn-dependent oxidoreductase